MSKKVSINWDTANDYTKGVCKEAGVWWKSKSSKALDDFNKAKVLNPDTTSIRQRILEQYII